MRVAYLAICGLALGLGGCAACTGALNWLFGDGTPEGGAGAAGTIGPLLNMVIPGASAVLAGAGGLWAAIRGKKWKRAFVATADIIEQGAKVGKSVADLKGDLKVAHKDAGYAGLVRKVVDKYGHAKPAAEVK